MQRHMGHRHLADAWGHRREQCRRMKEELMVTVVGDDAGTPEYPIRVHDDHRGLSGASRSGDPPSH